MGAVDNFRVNYLADSLRLLLHWWWWKKKKSVSEMLTKRETVRWKRIRRKSCACGMPLGGFLTPLGPHTAAGADAVAGGGYDDDHGDDDGH